MKFQLSIVVVLASFLSQTAAVAQTPPHRLDGISFCERWHELKAEYEDLSLTHTPDHPVMVSSKKRIALLVAVAKERDPDATPDGICSGSKNGGGH